MNIKDTIKNLKSHFKKKETPDNIPLTGGSLFNDIQRLEAAEYITSIDLDRVGTKYPKNFDRTVNYHMWMVLNLHCDYFANYFKIYCENPALFEAIIKVFRGYFYFGNAGILFINNSYIPVYEIKSNFNSSGELTSVEVGYLTELFARENSEYYKPPKNTLTIKKNMLKDYIRLSGGVSAYIKWLPFVKLQTQLLTMINDHRFFIHKNLGINCKDPSVLQKEIEMYFNLEVPFFINIGSTTNTNTNNFLELGGVNNANDKIISYYEQTTKIYYELLGRRKNTDFKKERNITAEVAASQSNFDILLNNEQHYKKLFLKQISEKTGEKVYLIEQDYKESGSVKNETESMNQSE